jgi:hypothetical protein
MIDTGKRRWYYPDKKLRRLRTYIHIVVNLINFAIIAQYIGLYVYEGKK